MAGFILGTGSGVLAAAAVYYTMSTHLAQDTSALQAELDRTTFLLDSTLDPQAPPAPVSQVGPSRNPYEPRFSDLLRTKWNQALERGVDSVRSTDWTSVGAGIAESGRGVMRKINGEVEDLRPVAERAERRVEEDGRRIVRDIRKEAAEAGQRVEQTTETIFDKIQSAIQTTTAAAEDATRTMGKALKEIKEDSKDLVHLAQEKAEEKVGQVERAVEEEKKKVVVVEEYHEGVLKGASGVGIISAAAEDLGKESFTGGAAVKVRAKRLAEGTVEGRLV